APGLKVGDRVLIRDATYANPGPQTGRNLEINRVLANDGTTITLARRLLSTYAVASSAEVIYLDAPHDFYLADGARFELPGGTHGGGIQLLYADKAHVGEIES